MHEERESDYGYIYKVAGPLVIGEAMSGAAMYELVRNYRVNCTVLGKFFH